MRAEPVEVGVDLAAPQDVEGGGACGEGDGVGGHRPGLVDRPGGGEQIHQPGGADDSGEGEAAADDLAEGGDVGADIDELLISVVAESEAGDDLIEDQDGAVLGAEVAETLEEGGALGEEAVVGGQRLDDGGGDLRAMCGECLIQRGLVIEREDEGGGGDGVGDPGGS